MKLLRQIHLYLGCLFAPVLIFFAVSGSWQLFALHLAAKDGSYKPPHAAALLSGVHQYQHLLGTPARSGTPLKFFVLAAAVGLVLTTLLGIVMAFRYSRSVVPVALCLLAGIALPVTILLIYR